MESKKNIKRDFKKGISVEDNRRRREESSIRLRKDSKCEGIAKRRNIGKPLEIAQQNNLVASNDGIVENLLLGLQSNEETNQTNSLRNIRRLLSAEKNPPVKQCIEAGLVPILVAFLSKNNFEQQFEAAWALTNIASTDQTRFVVDCEAVPALVKLLMSENPDIREQSAWCLGNIAGDGADLRDLILSNRALEPLLLNITQPSSISVLRNCVWTLSNFCRGKPQPAFSEISSALPVLASLLISEVDVEVMTDAAWALSYLSDGDDSRIQKVVELGILPTLVKMISSGVTNMIIPALRTLGNIVSGNDCQTQAVIDAHTLPPLCSLLQNAKKSIRKETCWVLSNIAAGTQQQMNSLFGVPDLISRVLHQLNSATEWDVRKEAAWVICNLITSSAEARIIEMVELGAIHPLCDLLNAGDSRVILIALDALEAILRVNNNLHSITQLIEEAGGVDLLEKLQEHENTKVYQKTVQILERYFNVEEDSEENFTPNVLNNNFSFGSFSKVDIGGPKAANYSLNHITNFSF